MKSNVNLYTTELTATVSHFTVGATKLIYIPNTTIYPHNTPQVHTHTGTAFPTSSVSCWSLEGLSVCSAEL